MIGHVCLSSAMSLFVIVFLCHKVTGMRFVLKSDKLLGNGTFVCGYVCVSLCLCVFVSVSGISSVLN